MPGIFASNFLKSRSVRDRVILDRMPDLSARFTGRKEVSNASAKFVFEPTPESHGNLALPCAHRLVGSREPKSRMPTEK